MRPLVLSSLFSVLVSVLVAACASPPPVAPLKHASAQGLRMRCGKTKARTEEGDTNVAANAVLQRAVVDDLVEAGYVLVEKDQPYDVACEFSSTVVKRSHDDAECGKASLKFLDAHDKVVDRIAFEFKEGIAPITEPKRVSHTIVNAVVDSRALAELAQKKASSAEAK